MRIVQENKGHYKTHKTTTTPKMSTSSNTKSRCSLSTTALLTFLLLNLQLLQIQGMSADYGDAAGNSEVVSKSDDIYDPAQLEQVLEEEEKQNNMSQSFDDTETETIAPLNMHDARRNMPTNQISAAREEYPKENVMVNATSQQSTPSDSLEDEYNDNEHFIGGGVANATRTTVPPAATTAMIPEYVVRKAKAETFKVKHKKPVDDNVSMSDYEDEVDGDVRMPNQESEATRRLFIQHQADQIVPLARKFYQTQDDEDDNEDVQEVDEDIAIAGNVNDLLMSRHHSLVPLPQQQFQLPKQHLEQNFRNLSAEEYYEDSRDESYEQLVAKQQHFLASTTIVAPTTTSTSTPSTTTTTMTTPATEPAVIPNFIGSRAGVEAWTRTSTTPTTTSMPIITTTIATFTNNPTTTTTPATTTAAPTTTKTTTTTTTALPTTSRPAPTPSASTPTTTAPINSNKQGKQIHISRRKLLPHEQLRNYIEDAYIRMPLAVIVDPSTESLEKTKALWRDTLRTNYNIKIVLVALNASGIPAAFSFNNTRQFLAGLNSIKENNGGNAFIGIVHASELVPYDSAVFISTAAIPPHTELVQDAAITLLKKRIRLYVLWFGERSITENETQEGVGGILGEVAIRSGGETLNIVGSENSQELEGNTLTLVADAYIGPQEVDVPVDTTMASLHVKIDSPMRSATLETPNGDINLKKLVKFKSRIMTLGPDDKRLDAYVPLTKLRKATVFKLRIVPETLEDEYTVFVRADRKADLFLDDMIKRFDSYFMDGMSSYPTKFRDTRLNSITAALAVATIPTHDNLKFPENEHENSSDDQAAPKSEVETFSEIEINNIVNKTAIVDGSGTFIGDQRTSSILQQSGTKIEMGTQSQVLVAPGMMAQLYFEITNTRTEAVYHNIQVIDERKFLQRLSPQNVFVPAGSTTTVVVTVLVPTGTAQGTIDKITFTCHGSPTVSLSLNLKVLTSLDAQDTTAPDVSWSYSSRCDYVPSNSATCAEHLWMLDITAQDWQTGIMRLQSTPSGLIYRNSYTVGSTEPLKATYISTCCQPKVSLVAHDIAGNQRAYTIDVRDVILSEASIAAIVLGALLLILLIVLIVIFIVWCCRRRKVTLDLPTYRSHSTRSME